MKCTNHWQFGNCFFFNGLPYYNVTQTITYLFINRHNFIADIMYSILISRERTTHGIANLNIVVCLIEKKKDNSYSQPTPLTPHYLQLLMRWHRRCPLCILTASVSGTIATTHHYPADMLTWVRIFSACDKRSAYHVCVR